MERENLGNVLYVAIPRVDSQCLTDLDEVNFGTISMAL
jgi:hypothetical protein